MSSTCESERGLCGRRPIILSIGLCVSVLLPASVGAQVFGKGARTEFITGFGFRTFASVMEMTDPSADGQADSPVFRRRVTPLSIVYGARPTLSVIAVLPFVDTALAAPSSVATPDLGGDGGLGDAVFLAKWRFYKRDRGIGTFRLAVEGGVKAPTGANDLRDPSGQRLPQPLQRGSGSWDPTIDVTGTYVPSAGRGRWVFTGDVGGTVTTEANNFEFGDRVSYDGMVKYRIHPARYPGRDTFLLVELNGRWHDRASANGAVVPDSGGHVIYVSPGIQFRMGFELRLSERSRSIRREATMDPFRSGSSRAAASGA